MSDFLFLLLRLSILGSLLSGLLFLVRLASRGRISQTVYYYLWLPVLLRLCIPGGIVLPLPAGQEIVPAPPPALVSPAEPSSQTGVDGEPGMFQAAPGQDIPETPSSVFDNLLEILKSPGLWVSLWGLGALAFLGWYIGGYLRFSHRIKRSLQPPSPEAAALLQSLEPEGRVRLAVCPLADANTSMLLGLCHPLIVLPPGLADEALLRDILSHELIHARRLDLLYKWFAAVTASLHWFNPVMGFVRKEISRACELSCDEAVVRGMAPGERQHYGETLLELAAEVPSGQGHMAVTLCEEKRHLKQRLMAIAQYHKKSSLSVLLSLLSAGVISGCALFSGAEQQPMENAYEAYRAVLLGETQIALYKDGESSQVSVEEAPAVFSPDSEYAKIDRFSIVDLDGDGESEAVLQVIDVAGDMGGFLVLHRERGEVCGYPRSYREFESLKTDGTYVFTSPAGTEWGICTGGFSGREYTPKTLVSGKAEEEYNTAMDRQQQKPDVVWYEFTDENIERAFSGAAPENTPASNQISQQAAEALEADFREYWDTVKDGMVLPVVSVFQTNRFEGMEHTVFVVYPTWRKSCTVVYGVNGNTVKRLGEDFTGFDFAFSSAKGGMFRTTLKYEKILQKDGEIDDNYYTVSPEGIELVLSLGASFFEEEIEEGFIYQEGGTIKLTAEEYRLRKEEADQDFSEAQIISFAPADFGDPGTGFDISSQESFAEYILSNGMN